MNRLAQTVPVQYDTVFSPFPAIELDAALAHLKSSGLDGVELAVAYPSQVDGQALMRKLSDTGLVATTLSTGQIYGLEGLFLSSCDSDIRRRAVETVKGHVDLSLELGKPNVTVGLLRGKLEPEPIELLLENLRCALGECADYALRRGVMLQLEPISRGETSLLHNVAETLAFFDTMGNPESVGILYDTYHSFVEGEDALSAVKAATGRIMNVHICDTNRGLPGDGDIDFKVVCGALIDSGYTGAFALETKCVPSAEYIKKHYAASLKRIFGEE